MNVIVCVDNKYSIGFENKLLFNIKKDMEYFKEKTMNKVVVMGRKTLESLPNAAPLKNRVNIVLTTKGDIEGCICVESIKSLLDMIEQYDTNDVYVIGGEQIYFQLLPYCDTAYITKVDRVVRADAVFPNIDLLQNWEITKSSEIFYERELSFEFKVLTNREVTSGV